MDVLGERGGAEFTKDRDKRCNGDNIASLGEGRCSVGDKGNEEGTKCEKTYQSGEEIVDEILVKGNSFSMKQTWRDV